MLGWVSVDCHVHTRRSGDAVTEPADIAALTRLSGLDAVFVTDHHHVDGAHEARRARGEGDPRIFVGEEIRTEQGEIMGLFLRERIPGPILLVDAVRLIRGQGGVVVAPHPFDESRDGLGERLEAAVESGLIDVIEGANAKVADPRSNRRAVELARRHDLPISAGSDAHDPSGVGAARTVMPSFSDGPSFLAALRRGRSSSEYRPHARRYPPHPVV